MADLPQTGTALLLEKLTVFLDDALINELAPPQRGAGQPRAFNSAQLLRVLLLGLLTPAHSFNLLLKLLPENRAWRKFAHLPNRRSLPHPKMLHHFRARLDLDALRELNASLVRPLLAGLDPSRLSLAIMDATDLPAAANGFKKTARLRPSVPLLAPEPSKPAGAVGSSATRNTACGYGFLSVKTPCYWHR